MKRVKLKGGDKLPDGYYARFYSNPNKYEALHDEDSFSIVSNGVLHTFTTDRMEWVSGYCHAFHADIWHLFYLGPL